MSRIKVATLHFIISLAVVASIISLMLLLWFPGAYFSLMGGKTLIYLIAGVDVFLGPLLTLVVFQAGKKSLKFDLTCIAILQLAAMSYGLYVMFEARPIFTVFNKNAFHVASAVDIVPSELAKGKKPEWRTASITGPMLTAIGEPDKNNKQEVMFAISESDLAYRYPKLFDDYNAHKAEVIKAGKALTSLTAISAQNKLAIDELIKKENRPESDFLYLPISSELAEMTAIVDAKTGDFIQIIDAK